MSQMYIFTKTSCYIYLYFTYMINGKVQINLNSNGYFLKQGFALSDYNIIGTLGFFFTRLSTAWDTV